jgi:hypothetical protein
MQGRYRAVERAAPFRILQTNVSITASEYSDINGPPPSAVNVD